MNYLLDTNIVLIYTRESPLTQAVDRKLDLFNKSNNLFISVVTIGELKSIILQRQYGKNKLKVLDEVLSKLAVIDINFTEIIDGYGSIDAFSQGKLINKPSNFTARNMGKNDLWIAATASVYDLVLVTTDKDFAHLEEEFLRLEYVDLQDYK